MKTSVDLSVLVTFHNETLVAGPTMAAADAAVACARAAGFAVETLMVLDNATPATTEWCNQDRFDHWQKIERSEGDLGRVRNAVVPQTKGRFIAFLDADDLFSENWLREGIALLNAEEAKGTKAIAHPELNWLFDGAHSVFFKPSQDDPLFTPYHFYFMNYYDSLCMAPRACHLEHPYVHRDIPNGLSFQDWQFAIETMDAGWKHLNAKDTIIFKRRRETSLVMESRNRMAILRPLDAMTVDKIDGLGSQHPPVRNDWQMPDPTARTDTNTPQYGAFFADRVARAVSRKGAVPDGKQAQYDRVKQVFDHAFYLSQNPDILKLEDVDPVAHYVRAARNDPRDPAPWFGTRAYMSRYEDVAKSDENPLDHWLTTGRVKGYVPQPMDGFAELAQVLGMSEMEAFAHYYARYTDLRKRLTGGTLGEMVRKAADHDPLVEQAWSQALRVRIPPFQTDVAAGRTGAIWRLIKACGATRAKHVICVNRARFGGAPRIEGHIARSLADEFGAENVIVMTTDKPGEMPEGKFPDGVRVIDFAALATEIRGSGGRRRILAEFLRALAPDAVYNINSRRLWETMEPYGVALATSMRLYAILLCNERDPMGYQAGYPLRRVYRHFDELAGIFTDSHFLADDLTQRYAIPSGKVRVLSNPVDPTIPLSAGPSGRPQVFWAGRFDAQKRVDLVYEIAAAMPDIDFRLWGEVVMGGGAPLPEWPPNLTLEGTYRTFTDLPLNQAHAWLYTSGWDGVPTILLEVAMTGIPLIGSDVGGTGEVLQSGLSRSLSEGASVGQWVHEIRATLADPEARCKAAQLREALIRTRTRDAHRAILRDALS